MRDAEVLFETAKLAKENRFECKTLKYYSLSNDTKLVGSKYRILFNHNSQSLSISAPTQSLLQRWLREKHRLHVVIYPEFYTTGINYTVQIFCYDPTKIDCIDDSKTTMMFGDNGEYQTYEEALEFGLITALKLIK